MTILKVGSKIKILSVEKFIKKLLANDIDFKTKNNDLIIEDTSTDFEMNIKLFGKTYEVIGIADNGSQMEIDLGDMCVFIDDELNEVNLLTGKSYELEEIEHLGTFCRGEIVDSHEVSVYSNRIEIGCQTMNKGQCENAFQMFADFLGYEIT